MKRFVSTMLAMVALTGAAFAQVSGMELGYCNGQVNTTGNKAFTCSENDTYVSAAIYLPSEALSMFGGCEIGQINAGLASVLNVDELIVWVRSDLAGENLASGTMTKKTTPKINKGWNLVSLETPYQLSDTPEGLYIGLSFHQTSTSVGLSVLDPATVAPVEGGLYVQMGSNAEWVDRSKEGVLPIEAMFFGDRLPKFNLSLVGVTTDPTYVVDKGKFSGIATVRNLAANTISEFDLAISIDDIDHTFLVHCDEAIGYKEEKEYYFEINPGDLIPDDSKATRTLHVEVANLKEGTDEYPDNNKLSVDFEVVNHDYARNVIVEEFTTEQCGNCPRVAGQMHAMLEMPGMDERTNVLCHHAGYYTDWLTIPADNTYTWLYNMGGSTFAPAVMVDRVTRPGNYTDYSPIFMPQSADHLASLIKNRMKDVAYVCVNIDATITDNAIEVKVSGERVKPDFTRQPARLVIALVEDNIKAKNQAGGGTDFVHQHVNRAYNSVWGNVIEWDGNNYEGSYTFKIDNKYVKENLSIVAYVWDYDPDDVTKCEICNSGRVRYAEMTNHTSGVEELPAAAVEGAVEYFNLDGVRLQAPQNGFNIVRNADGTFSKVMIRK